MERNEDAHEAVAQCGIGQGPSKKWSPSGTTDGCFDCNICLDSAQDPVVTLCGHLYCWPCIYKWLNHKGDDGDDGDDDPPRRCPICNVGLSESMMVPLYGHGDRETKVRSDESGSHSNVDIPHRPSPCKGATRIALDQSNSVDHLRSRPRQRRWDSFFDDYELPPTLTSGVFHSSVTSMTGSIGGTAFLVLPWVFGFPERPGLQYSYPYYPAGPTSPDDVRRMRREAASARSLRRISAFLLCCSIVCLLMF